ncbi:glycosyltransferase family 1 protein [Sporosarcina sp. G11-34]|uniref:glycosyltransferase family 1 protein n=1 Tax=Sporosarcina sp. G11-34 TaxID=2849605 RepID=UPI0022A9F4E5|nr:glycosyltransferase family 1 protein [Sporosarcina sp. G11-34]MCZ2257300.1 glycosyltransferase family 1 protein [Sporosarcina sp. G11-34]
MEPIRVLHVVTLMNRGGLESMLMNYYRNIDRNRIQFDFLEHREGKHDFTDEILSLGGKIYTVPPFNPLNTNGYINEIDNFFKENQEYKIVHSHLDTLSTYPLKYAKKYGVPNRIAHSHSTSLGKNWKKIIKMYSRSKITTYATQLFSCGEEAGKWLFNKSEFQILKNAIDTKKFVYNSSISYEKRKSLGIEDKFVIGHIGRFTKEKNHEFLIDIFEKIYQKNKKSVLLLIGVGNLVDKMKEKVESLGLTSAVKFLGTRDDIHELLQAIDVFVFPSLYEGLPVTLVEAQASGLNCIVSNTISKEVDLTQNIKFLSLDKGPEIWSDFILDLMSIKDRENMYSQIRDKGFDIESNVKWLENFYINLYNTRKMNSN